METPAVTKDVLRCFAVALEDAFRIQLSLKVEIASLKASSLTPNANDAGALILFSSPEATGKARLLFNEAVLNALFEKMVGQPAGGGENATAASEMLNILYASARKKVNQMGHGFLPAIPEALPKDHSNKGGHWPDSFCFTCKSGIGNFTAEVTVRKAG